MYLVRQFSISKDRYPGLYAYMGDQAHLACNLYNASLFRIRQIFTGWNKLSLTANEAEVFLEVAELEYQHPDIRVNHVISYCHLEKLMRATENPDFFAGLSMQTAQGILKQACQDFKNWLKALRAYKKDPSKFLGKPKMPGYKKPGSACTYTMTNQDAVLYPSGSGFCDIKLPKTKERICAGKLDDDAKLVEARVKPFYGRYLLSVTMETETVPADTDMPNMAAIDFGTGNIAAIVSTDFCSKLYKGGAILSENRRFAMQRAKAVSIMTKGHKTEHCVNTKHLDGLSFHHACFNRDQCHKISKDILSYCVKHHVGTLVLGVNKGMKQDSAMGKANNQLFYGVPLYMLRSMIMYKAEFAGITVIEQEESYTSKADCTAGDHIPTYGVDDRKASFSGIRVKRGLYRTHDGKLVNADLNGAANILRKAFPDAWKHASDFSFLNNPEVSGFHELNPQSIPVKRIAAA